MALASLHMHIAKQNGGIADHIFHGGSNAIQALASVVDTCQPIVEPK